MSGSVQKAPFGCPGGSLGCPGVDERLSRKFGSGWEALTDVREWSGDPGECPGVVGGLHGCPGVIGRPSRMPGSG